MTDFDRSKVFNRGNTETLPINTNEFDALIGYFRKRGFTDSSAKEIGSILLRQAQIQNIPVFQLIDTLKGLNEVQLSDVITQIINLNRSKSSAIGYTVNNTINAFEARNIEGLGG